PATGQSGEEMERDPSCRDHGLCADARPWPRVAGVGDGGSTNWASRHEVDLASSAWRASAALPRGAPPRRSSAALLRAALLGGAPPRRSSSVTPLVPRGPSGRTCLARRDRCTAAAPPLHRRCTAAAPPLHRRCLHS